MQNVELFLHWLTFEISGNIICSNFTVWTIQISFPCCFRFVSRANFLVNYVDVRWFWQKTVQRYSKLLTGVTHLSADGSLNDDITLQIFMLDFLHTTDCCSRLSFMHDKHYYVFVSLHLFLTQCRAQCACSASVKTTRVSPLSSLRCQGGEMRTERRELRAGDSFSSLLHPWPVPRHSGLRVNMANFDALCMSWEMPCVVWRAVLPSGWFESTITPRLGRAEEGGPDSSHFCCNSSSTSVLRDDHGAGVHRRGCRSLSEHAGRRFLLRWQVGFTQRSCAATNIITIRCSTCHLVTSPQNLGGAHANTLCPRGYMCTNHIFQLYSETQRQDSQIRTLLNSIEVLCMQLSMPVSWAELLQLIYCFIDCNWPLVSCFFCNVKDTPHAPCSSRTGEVQHVNGRLACRAHGVQLFVLMKHSRLLEQFPAPGGAQVHFSREFHFANSWINTSSALSQPGLRCPGG